MRCQIAVVAFLILMSFIDGNAWCSVQYTVTDLGTLGGSLSDSAGVNVNGQIVGYGSTSSGSDHAYLYANGTMHDLSTLGGVSSWATDINACGQVVGYSDTSGYQQAFLYSNGTMTTLAPPLYPYSQANGINDNGQVSGFCAVKGGNRHAFLYSNGTMNDLGTLPGGYYSEACGINASGQVAGFSAASNGNTHAFLYSNGTMTDLGTLPGGLWSLGYGINSSGQVAGYAETSSGVNHAFICRNGTMTDLGTLIGFSSSEAWWINGRGQIVGEADASGGTHHAFLYSNGTMVDLNNEISTSLGWTLTNAEHINDNGLIVGQGVTPGGQTHAFLLTPAATIALSDAVNTTIITGGTSLLGTTLCNSAATGANNLNYTLTAALQSGNATLGTLTPNSGSLVPGGTQSATVSTTSTSFGVNSIVLTASDSNSTNTSQSINTTLTVLDHSNASLSPSVNQMTQTINFGNVLRGATIPGQSFTICNRAANTTVAYTTNLKLTGSTATGDAALNTTLSSFNGLAAGSGKSYTASLDTSNYTTTGTKTIIMAASQLADDSTLSGAGNNNNGGITITLQGNAGNATADMSNSQSSFGIPLTAPVAKNASYTSLESKPTTTTGVGGIGLVGGTATILAGTNGSGSSQTVSMQWRTQTLTERMSSGLLSDVVRPGGMSFSGNQTSPFVLQMTYNPSLLPSGSGSESLRAASERIDLAWLNPSDSQWENAIGSNFGTNSGSFHLGAWPNGDMTLGDWGVNTSNHTVWAVLNHSNDYSVVSGIVNGQWARNGSGNWGGTANWTGGNVPGIPLDTAAFGTSLTSGTATITLDSSRSLSSLGFSTTGTTSYVISPSGTSTLTLLNSAGTATISSSGGNDRIASPIVLGSNLSVTASTGSVLTLAAAISGSNESLSFSGGGKLILSGTNTYTGGTNVIGGTLVVTNASALPNTGVLTVGCNWPVVSGSGSSEIMGQGVNPSEQTDTLPPTPTPEPSTIFLLGVGAVSLLIYARRRRHSAEAPANHSAGAIVWACVFRGGQKMY